MLTTPRPVLLQPLKARKLPDEARIQSVVALVEALAGRRLTLDEAGASAASRKI
jgi:hypothetical protein